MSAHQRSPTKSETEYKCVESPDDFVFKKSSPLFQRVLQRQRTKEIPCKHYAHGKCPYSEIDCDYSHSDFHWLAYHIHEYVNCCPKEEEGEELDDSYNYKIKMMDYSRIILRK